MVRQLVADGDVSESEAEQITAHAMDKTLSPAWKVYLDDGRNLLIKDLIEGPDEFDGVSMADPLEPDYGGGRCKAKFYWNNGKPIINSHAHGGIKYQIENDLSGTPDIELLIDDPANKLDIRSAILETEDFLTLDLPEKTVYLDPWLTAQSILLISGFRGTGKTWLALSILVAIAKRTPFGPWPVHNSVPCLYLDGEMAAQDVQLRAVQLDQTGEKKNPLYIYSDAYASSIGLPRASLLNSEWRLTMKDILMERGVKVWVIDNLASLTPGIDENVKKDWDPINNWLLDLRFAGITTILLHHTNKSGGQRGTSAREDNIDISIMLNQPPGYCAEDGASFVMSFTKSRVATDKLSKIADTHFRLSLDDQDKLVWTYGNVKRQRKHQVLILKDKGWTNKEIADDLGCSIQNVGQIVKRAQADGYLTKDEKLSPSGFEHAHRDEK